VGTQTEEGHHGTATDGGEYQIQSVRPTSRTPSGAVLSALNTETRRVARSEIPADSHTVQTRPGKPRSHRAVSGEVPEEEKGGMVAEEVKVP
jgi:hypothetical protein